MNGRLFWVSWLKPAHPCGTWFHADTELLRTQKLGSVCVMPMAIAS